MGPTGVVATLNGACLVSMDYGGSNSAISQISERLRHGSNFPCIMLNSNRSEHAFIGLVGASLRVFVSSRVRSRVLTVSIDGRYLFPDVMLVLHPNILKEDPAEMALTNMAIGFSGSYITLSEFVAERLKRKYRKPVKVIRCGVQEHDIPRQKRHGDEIVVSHVGGIAPGRSRRTPMLQLPEILREAFPDRKIRLIHVAGKWNWNEEMLRANCEKAGIRFDLRGAGSNDEMFKVYAESDIYVYLSLEEGYSITPGEALTMEKPVVISDLPVHREVYGGKPGVFFCRNGEKQSVVDALRTAYETGSSPVFREKALERTWQDMVDEFNDYVAALI